MSTPDYSIQAIGELTGVLPVTLRAWERRYGLIRPARTARGHRRYSDADLHRIRRILAWLERGLPIGQVRALLDGEDAPVLAGDPWRRAVEDGLAALEARNVRRLEQWFQGLVADYALDKVLTHCCDPLREHLRSRPDGAAARLLLDSVLRQKLGGRALALAPDRRDPAWLVLAVGDPLPALSRAVARGAPVWCLEDAPPWSALASWLADPRTRGVLWVLGEHPGRRRADQLWPADAVPHLPVWCTGPALTDELITPPWLRRVPGDRAALYAAWDADLHHADNEHADKQGDAGATGMVS
ncbi:MerR family transcriptional regulator [Alloalcanivorax sp. C16-1]|uniref:MerR family transcriptional regulator n=1 Tax=Alloalcanivorax sp. C16-1 TaxID=3390051 RepID=UPI0039709CE9